MGQDIQTDQIFVPVNVEKNGSKSTKLKVLRNVINITIIMDIQRAGVYLIVMEMILMVINLKNHGNYYTIIIHWNYNIFVDNFV